MQSSALLRPQIELTLARRIPSALTPRVRAVRPVIATGIGPIDELLEGGFPVGAITEMAGSQCSGRATLALAFMAQNTMHGQVCAWVDVMDSLDPPSAAASGVHLDRLLWVRCGAELQAHSQQDKESVHGTVNTVTHRTPVFGGGSPHPRSEERGLSEAISDLLHGGAPRYGRDHSVGTPGVANRTLRKRDNPPKPAQREEQIPFDRLPARRGEQVFKRGHAIEPRCAEAQRKPRPAPLLVMPQFLSSSEKSPLRRFTQKPWFRIEQAIKTTDLLMQAGGFSCIVLDLGTIPAEFSSRIPLSTWFRFRAAADRNRTSLILLTQNSCAQSSAEVLLRLSADLPTSERVMGALPLRVELVRQRFMGNSEQDKVVSMRKSPQGTGFANWVAPAPCAALR